MDARTGGVVSPPLEQVRARPWAFVFIAVVAGFGAGFLLRFPRVRKGLRAYALARQVASGG